MIRQHCRLTPAALYAVEFQRRLSTLLGRRFGLDADDIAQHEVERLLRRIDEVMATYPVAEVYASVRAGHAAQDHLRRNAVQRGEGARTSTDADGRVRRGRVVLSGDAPGEAVEDGCLFDRLPDSAASIAETVVDQFETHRLLEQALLTLPADQVDVLTLVDGHGYTVKEAGALLGVARETASRRRASALRSLAGQFADAA